MADRILSLMEGKGAACLAGGRGRATARIPADLVQRIVNAARHERRALVSVLAGGLDGFGNTAAGKANQ